MQRKNIIVLMISLSLVLLLGSSYALLKSTQVGTTPYVINVGTLQVTFDNEQTDVLTLENMYPMSDKEGSSQINELGFTVKNTGTVASYYDITLEETSVSPEFKSVIRFISNKDSKGYNEPKTLSEDKYIEVGGYLEPNKNSSYKVKIWLDYNADNTYMNKEFKAKVVVNSFQESKYAKDVIKSKLVSFEESSKEDFAGGLVAVNTNGDLYNETDESQKVREYRYSGPNVNNYVTFNDEAWRIIGVFKDEVGEEFVKIVRNNVLTRDMFPVEYRIEDTTYNIQSTSGNNVYWNKKVSGTINNDWATTGLQYWLNTIEDENEETKNKGYLSYLKGDTLSMIEEVKYYLGTVTYFDDEVDDDEDGNAYGIWDTPKEVYKNERAITGCKGGIGPIENSIKNVVEENSDCRVWSENSATWKGKIGLMYLSDYGFSASSDYWNTKLVLGYFNKGPSDTSWLHKTANHVSHEWLLSPTSSASFRATRWESLGNVGNDAVDHSYCIRPTLYLKSNVKITRGDGTSDNPYELSLA